MRFTPRVIALAGALAAGLATAGTAAAAIQAPPTPPAPNTAQAHALAAKGAAALVANRPQYLHASADDQFVQQSVISTGKTQYVPYIRMHKGLPVVGGDFVMVTDTSGAMQFASVAQQQPIGDISLTPKVSQAAAEAAARPAIAKVDTVGDTHLVVYALTGTPTLAWETTVTGSDAEGPAKMTVDVDAATGVRLHSQERVLHGDGNTAWNGPKPVHLDTTHSGSTYSMTDPTVKNLSCGDFTSKQIFTGPDDTWGNGDATNKETGCADALYVAQTEVKMLKDWDNRSAMDGNGGAWPIRVGDAEQNAYYDGSQVAIGYNTKKQWIGVLDVVGHEMGHGIDDHTPGGISGNGTQEFVADTFGAATEWYANQPAGFDTPDFTVGETINLVGTGPIRYMYDPSKAGDDNCYSSRTPTEEVHAAAGPGNHWFYLMAEGTNPTDGQPTSPTCNNSTVKGIGIKNAEKIMYNAMLMKTSGASYLKYRTWTLQAAKNLTPNDCAAFTTVKAAWDAVSVPAQAGDPTCSGGPPPTTPPATTPPTTTPPTTTPPGNCSGQKLVNPGFESGATSWTSTNGVIGQNTANGEAAHTGTYNAWLDGYGSTHTDSLSQSVTIPAGCKATLSFWLHIDTSETTTTKVYDKLTVQAGTKTLATLSNLDKGNGYVQKTYDLSSLAGQTVTVKFTGTEDSGLQTSFVIDDTAVTLG